MHKVELLAPAADLESLKIAIAYGADAVYIGGESYGMKTSSKNFSKEDMLEGIRFAHEKGKKVYVSVNLVPHNDDFRELEEYLLELEEIGTDAVVISDPGVLEVVKRVLPNMEIHLGTQANINNYVSANFWYNQGIKRVVVSRELSCEEIAGIRAKTPLDMDIETYVHGAICLSYSGRPLLSNYLTAKDVEIDLSNKSYNLVEEKRQGEYCPIYEDKGGTFFFNSKDLCMINFLPELIKSGVTTLSLEGRMKEPEYIASLVRVYKMALDAFYKDPENWTYDSVWMDEIRKISNRPFTSGFYLDETEEKEGVFKNDSKTKTYESVAIVKGLEKESGLAILNLRNMISIGEDLEVIGPFKNTMIAKVEELYNENNECIDRTYSLEETVKVRLSVGIDEDYILRREIQDEQ